MASYWLKVTPVQRRKMDAPRSQSIDEATRHLITLISDQMRTDSQQQTGQQQQATAQQNRTTLQPLQQSTSQQQTAVQREMTRSFPGYFLKAQHKGRKRVHSPCKVVKNKTGMGRRTVMLQDNADHLQITSQLMDHYPKLSNMTGGWLFYKALGGSGQRKLIVVPPEADGYNTQYLRSVSGGGKITVYIVPLQDELDTTPLPPDAHEFKKMPKATCQICSLAMPLQVLAVHVKSCSTEVPSNEDDADSSERAACPLRLINFPVNDLEYHASFCGESLDDVLKRISGAVITEGKTFHITVSRHNMLERGLVQWQRQKKSSQVVFLGEAGIDTGVLSKEFLTEMVGGIEKCFFEGGRPKYSLTDLDKGHFKSAGEIMAVSIAQGGPAPNFLMDWCYNFLCSGSLEFEQLNKNDLGAGQYRDLIAQVESATEGSIIDLTEDILSCGYLGIVSMEKKDEITRAITLHATLKLVPMLQEIRKGLKLYGLGDLMTKHPEICQSLFVPGTETEADAGFVISICQAEFSEKGSYREQVEVAMMNHLQDLLQELEQSDSASGIEASSHPSMSPKTFLQWVTGQGHIPMLSQEKNQFKITVQFNHNCDVKYSEHRICYPTVAACSNTIILPVKHVKLRRFQNGDDGGLLSWPGISQEYKQHKLV